MDSPSGETDSTHVLQLMLGVSVAQMRYGTKEFFVVIVVASPVTIAHS